MTLDHHDEATAQAMRVVARALIAEGARRHMDTALPTLDELNPYDASDIRRIVVELAPKPSDEDIRGAVAHLEARTVDG